MNRLGDGLSKRRMSDVSAIMDHSKAGEQLIDVVRYIIPTLDSRKHKGQRGKIAVIGGSTEYTGAPYFAAMSALRLGADLAHVFCPKEASPIIKGYSPDLIVHPLLDSNDGVNEICNNWIDKMHVVVIGPGLGRKTSLGSHLKQIIKKCKENNLPIIIDADGLYFVSEDASIRSLITNYQRTVLTPNVNEFTRLYQIVTQREMPSSASKGAFHLALEMGHVTVIRKGPTDAISNGTEAVECSFEGSPCRCGGQGDMLSGLVAVFAYWAYESSKHIQGQNLLFDRLGPLVSASYAACIMTRKCNNCTYRLPRNGAPLKDAMTMSDMLDMLHVAKLSLNDQVVRSSSVDH